jgi:serine/tyrosine/threonine adenylyltransferase
LSAAQRADYQPFDTLLKIVTRPFDDQPEFIAFSEPAPQGNEGYRTFCGT